MVGIPSEEKKPLGNERENCAELCVIFGMHRRNMK
jgi:hypothetical protein